MASACVAGGLYGACYGVEKFPLAIARMAGHDDNVYKLSFANFMAVHTIGIGGGAALGSTITPVATAVTMAYPLPVIAGAAALFGSSGYLRNLKKSAAETGQSALPSPRRSNRF